MDKEFILSEIRRTAVDHKPLGRKRFIAETGISQSHFEGQTFLTWSDAVREAGLEPNKMQAAHKRSEILRSYACLAAELGELPTTSQMRMHHKKLRAFPDHKTVFGTRTKIQLIAEVADYCRKSGEFPSVLIMCDSHLARYGSEDTNLPTSSQDEGYVYLVKSRRGYKIGRTYDWEQRLRQIQLHNPDDIALIHLIKTDDPSGVEAYWHRRFRAKRVVTKSKIGRNRNWYRLSLDDVSRFRRWKQI